jgi:ketosteroid isomerase-like protein
MPMADDGIRALVDDLCRAYRDGDRERVAAIIDDDIDWLISGPVEIFPFEGARRGKAAVLKVLGEIAAQYRLERYQPEIVVVDGDRAAVLSDVAFEQRATGRMLRFRVVNFLRFRDGRLVEFREFANTFDLVEQALGQHIEVPAGVLR